MVILFLMSTNTTQAPKSVKKRNASSWMLTQKRNSNGIQKNNLENDLYLLSIKMSIPKKRYDICCPRNDGLFTGDSKYINNGNKMTFERKSNFPAFAKKKNVSVTIPAAASDKPKNPLV